MKIVATIEKDHKIKKRWKAGEPKFTAAALSVEQERRNHTTRRLYALAVERLFLISLKKKYAGTLRSRF